MNILPTEFASKDSLDNSDLAKINRDYAFSAITPFHRSSNGSTIIHAAILSFEDGYFSNQIIT
jgi:hypothetical protein